MTQQHTRVLIVEDDRAWQQILSEILTDIGLTVDVANDLQSAIACVRAVPHRLAVVDLGLGEGDVDNQDGLDVLDAIRRQDPGCVLLMLTGFATVEIAVSVLNEYGAFTCLRKEAFDRAAFRTVVSQALASAPPLDVSDTPPTAGQDKTPPEQTDADGDRTPSGHVLVVEDDAGWRSILSELLHDAGYEVRLCSSYGEALGTLRRETYILAVIDLSLAGSAASGGDFWEHDPPPDRLDGYRLLASTRARGVPTIVVSGVATPDNIESAYDEHGLFAYQQKQSFDRHAFLQTVREAQAACRTEDELDCLTEREREVLNLLAQGMTNKEIAGALVITTNTVKRHLKSVFFKLDVHTRSAATAKAMSAKISL